MRVTAIVVNHNSDPDIHRCIDSLRASEYPVDIVVVDNASEKVPEFSDDIRLILSTENLGFGAGVNLGFLATGSDGAVLLINPDAVVEPSTVGQLVATLEANQASAIVGPLVVNTDGSVQPSKRIFPTLWQSALHSTLGVFWPGNPATRAYVCADAPLDRPTRVGWLSCSVALIRAEAFQGVGMFDPDFFFYVEDVDLCRRFADAGFEMWFEPRARAVHAWGGSTRHPARQLWQHHSNIFRYVRKHRRGWWILTYPAVIAGLALRFSLLLLRWLVSGRRLPSHHATREKN